jgi:hypothetical protein
MKESFLWQTSCLGHYGNVLEDVIQISFIHSETIDRIDADAVLAVIIFGECEGIEELSCAADVDLLDEEIKRVIGLI